MTGRWKVAAEITPLCMWALFIAGIWFDNANLILLAFLLALVNIANVLHVTRTALIDAFILGRKDGLDTVRCLIDEIKDLR